HPALDGLCGVGLQPQRLLAVVRAPTPLRIDRPERDVCKDNDRCAGREPAHVALEPVELFLPQVAEPARLEIEHVDQADEVDAAVIEAVPSTSLRALAVPVQVTLPVVAQDIVLAGYVENAPGLDALDDLVRRIEFGGLRELADVAGV